MRRVKNKKSLGHKIYFTLLLLIFLFGCATPAKYDAELAGWVGKSENKLIAEWGKPSARKINAERLARAAGIKGALSAQTIDCAGEVPELSVRPVGNMMLAKCCGGIDAGITPEDITVSDTVTVVWQAAD